MSKTFTVADVAKHDQKASDGMYIIVDGTVYDVTNFVDEHPGGAKILKRVAGKDASKQFWKVGAFFIYGLPVDIHAMCVCVCGYGSRCVGVATTANMVLRYSITTSPY